MLFFSFICTASNPVDFKARKRIEELFELTDEIINAYNEINEKYVSQIYRKYEQIKDANKKLKETLHRHHCAGCQCATTQSNTDERGEVEEKDSSSEDDNSENDDDEQAEEEEEEEVGDEQQPTNSALPSSTTNSIVTRSKKNNRSFIFISFSFISLVRLFSIHHSRY